MRGSRALRNILSHGLEVELVELTQMHLNAIGGKREKE